MFIKLKTKKNGIFHKCKKNKVTMILYFFVEKTTLAKPRICN